MIEHLRIEAHGAGLHEFAPELGAWQGIYLWEHRRAGGPRSVFVHLSP